jgi:hypothetical protein
MRMSSLCAPAAGVCLMMASVVAHANAAAPAPAAPAVSPPANELRVVGTKDTVATSDGPPDLDKVVCKVEPDTGSRIKTTKHCMSQRQSSAAGRSAAKKIDENATVVSFTD